MVIHHQVVYDDHVANPRTGKYAQCSPKMLETLWVQDLIFLFAFLGSQIYIYIYIYIHTHKNTYRGN